MSCFRPMLVLFLLLVTGPSLANKITIAAAADLRFALDEVISAYKLQNPEASIEVIYGSSGKMTTQIINGAPYDIFFSADISYPKQLRTEGFAVTEPEVYAIGRVVLWSARHDAAKLSLKDLDSDKYRRIAIAQPTHAPYGQRAKEAMQAAGVWDSVQNKLVFGENIAQVAQMAESGAADLAIIALSLAKFPSMSKHGYHLIDEKLHNPLTQGYVITSHGSRKAEALEFAKFMGSETTHEIMKKYGFDVSK